MVSRAFMTAAMVSPSDPDCRRLLLSSPNTSPSSFTLLKEAYLPQGGSSCVCIGKYRHAYVRIIRGSYVSAPLRFILQAGNSDVISFSSVLWFSQHPFSFRAQNRYRTNFAADKL